MLHIKTLQGGECTIEPPLLISLQRCHMNAISPQSKKSHCLFNSLFKLTTSKLSTSKYCITGLLCEISTSDGFPLQRANNAVIASMAWQNPITSNHIQSPSVDSSYKGPPMQVTFPCPVQGHYALIPPSPFSVYRSLTRLRKAFSLVSYTFSLSFSSFLRSW